VGTLAEKYYWQKEEEICPKNIHNKWTVYALVSIPSKIYKKDVYLALRGQESFLRSDPIALPQIRAIEKNWTNENPSLRKEFPLLQSTQSFGYEYGFQVPVSPIFIRPGHIQSVGVFSVPKPRGNFVGRYNKRQSRAYQKKQARGYGEGSRR
jgi:hypothetical protein